MNYRDKNNEEIRNDLQELQRKYNSLAALYEKDIAEHKLANEALRKSEDRYRRLVETTDTGYVIIDETGSVLDANPEYVRLSGHNNLAEILGRSVEEWTASDQRETNVRAVASCLKNGFIRNFEITYINKSGYQTPVEINATVMEVDGKRNILSLCHDISERKRSEEVQKQTSSLLWAALESTADGILVVDHAGNVSSFNKKFSELWRIPKPILDTGDTRKLLAFIVDQLKYPDQFISNVNELHAYPQKESFEIIEFKDGRVFERYSQPQMVDDKIVGRVWSFRDITEHRKAEELLRESENRFRKVAEYAPIAMAIVSMDGIIEFVNHKAVEVFGYSHEDIPTMEKWWNQAYPDENYRNEVITDWTGRVRKAVTENMEIIGNEYLATCKDGAQKTIFISGAPVSGKIFVLFDDITKRKRVEDALRESEERFSKAYKTSPISFMIASLEDGRILEVNDAFTAISGFTREEALASTTLELNIWVRGEDRHRMIAELLEGRPLLSQETLLRAKNGDIYIVLLSAQAIQLGHKNCIIASIEDITERKIAEIELVKAKEKAEESDRLKSAFLQNMSHEIRTPMNAIMGFASLITEYYNDKPKLEQFSEIINNRCNDLLEIINDILDIAKIESGQLPVHVEECSLFELFSELTVFFKEHQKRIGKQQIKFNLQAFCDPSDNIIITDKVKLKQIFINLIGNAFKFTEAGRIEGGCKLDVHHKLVFYVSDTGIGIPTDKHEAIFERFAQLEHNKNQVYGGTGLGLPIVKGLVGLLGGTIWLESEPGKGTVFYFSIPYKISHSAVVEPVIKAEPRTYHFPGKTILVVEDDYYNAAYIREILLRSELNTRYGNEAVQIAIAQSIDLVLMDIRLPDTDGYEATRKIKQHKPSLKVIAQTAYAAQEDKQKALDAGCDDYISKPLNRELLLSMLNKYL